MRKNEKNNLDERQEQILLQIEHRGCWFAFWGLLAVLVVEVFIFHMEPKAVAGEWIIFMCLALYLNFACMKNKIWDRRLKPDLKTNLSISVIAAVAVGALMAIGVWINYPDKPLGALAAGIITPIFVFIPCFFLLTISAKKLKKDIQKEEAEDMECGNHGHGGLL